MVIFFWGASIYASLVRPPADALQVNVVGKQWMWKLQHLEGRREINELHVPVGQAVKLTMTSEDVIHSFYIPNFRLKHDANPGYVTRTWFQALKPGNFEIACSQMCGWAHYKMKGDLFVEPVADFERWMKEAVGDAKRRFDPADKEQLWGWEWVQ